MQSEGDEGGICVVAESCHQTSEGIGLMASYYLESVGLEVMPPRDSLKKLMKWFFCWDSALNLL